jgi:hypothetical protein
MEIKRRPYEPPTSNDSAALAPTENDDDAPEFGAWYLKAQPGKTILVSTKISILFYLAAEKNGAQGGRLPIRPVR